jgi:hypothetical protein
MENILSSLKGHYEWEITGDKENDEKEEKYS